jgi:cytosine/adenosine deaminase-related metal-dependent hydrolase
MTARRLAADWVLPMGRPPIRRGAVLLDAAGRIAEVGPDDAVGRPAHVAAEQWTGATLIPGLVNAHTHLELTGLEGEVSDEDFPGWIRRVIALKAGRSPAQVLEAARQGVVEGWAAGVTTVADTGDSGAVVQALAELGGSGIAYHEIFGPDPGTAVLRLAEYRLRFDELRQYVTGRVRLGVSPHAPYSVSGALYAAVSAWAATEALPLAVHVAESAEEVELISRGAGAFAAQWRARGIAPPARQGTTPVEWLEHHGVLGDRTLCIHAVRVDGADIRRLAIHRCAVAHCPRSNRRHAGREAPLKQMLEAGLAVGVGTDSVASVSPPDLLAEAREARRLAGLDAAAALELCTRSAARAIGLEGEVGALAPGKWGDIAAVATPTATDGTGAEEAILAAGRDDVLATWLSGREVYRANSRLTTHDSRLP